MNRIRARVKTLEEFMKMGEFDRAEDNCIYLKDGRCWNGDVFLKYKGEDIFLQESKDGGIFIDEEGYIFQEYGLADIEIIKIDAKNNDPVIVWNCDYHVEQRRHFAYQRNGRYCTYPKGHSSWTYEGGGLEAYDCMRLPKDGDK